MVGTSRSRTGTTTRRGVLSAAAVLATGGTVLAIRQLPAAAAPADLEDAIRKITGGARLNTGKITLEIPPLVENGNTVPCMVTVESPMTATDHVRSIHILNTRNPQPNAIDMHLGPHAGRAVVSTRIRLSDTQTVLVIAALSDGSFWSQGAEVIVTTGACLEDA
jgi:sulfur-oxidizing protein SoxY